MAQPQALNNFQQNFIAKILDGRIDIHSNNYSEKLVDYLVDIYAQCERIVGEKFFRAMAREYVQHNNSQTKLIQDYGRNFAGFINDFPPAKNLGYLTDVAKLEWLQYKIEIGENNADFDVAAFKNIPENSQKNIILNLQKNSALLQSKYPLIQIINIKNNVVNLDGGGENLFIWRDGFLVKTEKINSTEYELLSL